MVQRTEKEIYMSKFTDLLAKKAKIESQMTRVNSDLHSLPGYHFLQAASNRYEHDLFVSFVDALIHEISQRDEPLTRAEIRDIFDASGYVYDMCHVDACNPDSVDTVSEQAKYYRD